MKAIWIDTDVDISEVAKDVYIPTSWMSELEHAAVGAAVKLLASEIAASTGTPWIISSLSKDIYETPRAESPSHMSGNAGDIAPMYSRDIILPPDPPLSSLSMNVLFLHLLAGPLLSAGFAAAVEADHIHVLAHQAPKFMKEDGLILTIPNPSTAYSIGSWLDAKLPPALFDFSSSTYSPVIGDLSAAEALSELVNTQEAIDAATPATDDETSNGMSDTSSARPSDTEQRAVCTGARM